MKKYFLTGLVILLPLILTIMILFFLVDLFTDPFISIASRLITELEYTLNFHIPESLTLSVARILALILLVIFIPILGMLTRWFLIKKTLQATDRMIDKIPLVKTIYKLSRDIFSALFSNDGKRAFKSTVIIPFPFAPSYGMGFHAGEIASEIQSKVSEPLIPVFVPTAPHPISGFLFLIPQSKSHEIQMSSEDTLKFLVSCGMIRSHEQTKL